MPIDSVISPHLMTAIAKIVRQGEKTVQINSALYEVAKSGLLETMPSDQLSLLQHDAAKVSPGAAMVFSKASYLYTLHTIAARKSEDLDNRSLIKESKEHIARNTDLRPDDKLYLYDAVDQSALGVPVGLDTLFFWGAPRHTDFPIPSPDFATRFGYGSDYDETERVPFFPQPPSSRTLSWQDDDFSRYTSQDNSGSTRCFPSLRSDSWGSFFPSPASEGSDSANL
jgi:hypothetical protein